MLSTTLVQHETNILLTSASSWVTQLLAEVKSILVIAIIKPGLIISMSILASHFVRVKCDFFGGQLLPRLVRMLSFQHGLSAHPTGSRHTVRQGHNHSSLSDKQNMTLSTCLNIQAI